MQLYSKASTGMETASQTAERRQMVGKLRAAALAHGRVQRSASRVGLICSCSFDGMQRKEVERPRLQALLNSDCSFRTPICSAINAPQSDNVKKSCTQGSHSDVHAARLLLRACVCFLEHLERSERFVRIWQESRGPGGADPVRAVTSCLHPAETAPALSEGNVRSTYSAFNCKTE